MTPKPKCRVYGSFIADGEAMYRLGKREVRRI
jgi:hypothetical protein